MKQVCKFTVLMLSILSSLSYAQKDIQDPILNIPQDADQNSNSAQLLTTEKVTAQRKPSYAFNSGSLFGANKDINLDHFRVENYVAPDRYFVNVSLNGNHLKEMWVEFDHLDASSNAVLCVDEPLLALLDLKQQTLNRIESKACSVIKDISPDAYYDFNLQLLTLEIYVPLADVTVQPAGYIAPQLFERGVTSAFVAYNANYYHSDYNDSQFLSLNAGLNLGGWYFRHQGNFQTDQSGDLDVYRSHLNTLYKDIDPLKSRLSLGEFYSQGQMLESLSILGAELASDESMQPWSMRNYAPQIQGVAQTNALVRVFQNGQQIYEKTVPMGPFELNDLSTMSSGDLRVEIIEQGGETRVRYYPMQANFDLLKKGRLKYQAAAGRYRLAEELTDDYIGQASFSYGLSNALTLSAGMTWAEHYQNYLISSSIMTKLGSFNLISDMSQSKFDHQDQNGHRNQAKYRYYFEPQKLSLHLSALQQSKQYQTASNAMAFKHFSELNPDEYFNYQLSHGLKNQYSVSLNKAFSNPRLGSLQASYYQNKYWNSTYDYDQYSLSYANRWKGLSYNLGFSQSNLKSDFKTGDQNLDHDRTIFASISLPLEWKNKNLYLSSQLQRQSNEHEFDQASVNLSGTLGEQNQFNFGVGMSHSNTQSVDDSTFNAHINYLHPHVNLGANTYIRGDEIQYALSAQGGLVAHRHGITATNDLPSTYTIVHVDQASKATLGGAWGTRLDRFGNAIYSHSAPYQRNMIQINSEDLAIDMSLLSNQSTVIPRMYSSTLVEFIAKRHSRYILRLSDTQGTIPVGAQLHTPAGKFIGYMGQSNQILLENFDYEQDHHLVLSWGREQNKQCEVNILPHQMKAPSESFQIIHAECK